MPGERCAALMAVGRCHRVVGLDAVRRALIELT